MLSIRTSEEERKKRGNFLNQDVQGRSIVLLVGSQEKPTFADAIRDTPATIIEALICFFSIWSVVGLWSYHTYLICRSVTTNEDVSVAPVGFSLLLASD